MKLDVYLRKLEKLTVAFNCFVMLLAQELFLQNETLLLLACTEWLKNQGMKK